MFPSASEDVWVTGSGGTRIAVRDVGAGPPVLLIPGLGYSSWSFVRQIGPLSERARVLAMDNRGTGLSDKPDGPYTIEDLAEDAYEVLHQRGAEPATVVGTSMGGYIALTLASQHPDAVSSLILTATTCGGPGSLGVPEETLHSWSEAAALGPEGFATATMPLSFAPGWCDQHPSAYAELLTLRGHAPTPVAAWQAQFAACAVFLHTGLPEGAIPHPTVIVHGTADRVVPYENAAHLAKRLPQASLRTMAGAGHLCWIERAQEFNDIVVSTVQKAA